MPGISILEVISQYSPGTAYATAFTMLVIMARMAVRCLIMIVPNNWLIAEMGVYLSLVVHWILTHSQYISRD